MLSQHVVEDCVLLLLMQFIFKYNSIDSTGCRKAYFFSPTFFILKSIASKYLRVPQLLLEV
jgi:hypothetical protein